MYVYKACSYSLWSKWRYDKADSVWNWHWDVILSDYRWRHLLLCYAQPLCSIDYEATRGRSSDQIALSFYATKVSKTLCLKSLKQKVTKMIPLKLFMHVSQERGIKIYPRFLHARGGNLSFADTCWHWDTYLYWCEKYFLEKTYLSSRKRKTSRKAYTDGFTQGNLMWAQSICSEKTSAEENGIIWDLACCHRQQSLIWVTAKPISGKQGTSQEPTTSATFWRVLGKKSDYLKLHYLKIKHLF